MLMYAGVRLDLDPKGGGGGGGGKYFMCILKGFLELQARGDLIKGGECPW